VLFGDNLEIIRAICTRPGYREYLKHKVLVRLRWLAKMLVRLGWLPLDHRYANLRLPGQVACFAMARDANDARATGPRSDKIKIRDLLLEKSPYENFDQQQYPGDLQGWGSDDPVLVDAVRLLCPLRVCEVGSWKGKSAIKMATTAKHLGLDTEIVCVDTWLGSPEHWVTNDHKIYESLRIKNGMPQIYFTFLANVVRAGLTDFITPFPMTSDNAAIIFAKLGVRFDLVYVDAAHEYGPAKRDFAQYFDLLAEDGLLIADDYRHWAGVTRAADEFAAERGLRRIAVPGKVVFPKGKRYAHVVLY
jgi:SAM-dependent methyltransferase